MTATLTRPTIVRRVGELVGGRAVRWVPAERATGDYDGRDNTLEIFDVEAREQRAMLRRLSAIRPAIERALGGALVVIFHTERETARLYPEMSYRRTYAALAQALASWIEQPAAKSALEPNQVPRFTFDAEAA